MVNETGNPLLSQLIKELIPQDKVDDWYHGFEYGVEFLFLLIELIDVIPSDDIKTELIKQARELRKLSS